MVSTNDLSLYDDNSGTFSECTGKTLSATVPLPDQHFLSIFPNETAAYFVVTAPPI